MDRSDFGRENTNCALRFSERYLSKTEGRRLRMIDSDSRGDISAISLPIGNAPKSFSRWHKQTSCKPQLENKNNRISYNSTYNAYQYYLIHAFIFKRVFILIRVVSHHGNTGCEAGIHPGRDASPSHGTRTDTIH